MAHHFKTPQ